MRHACPTAPLLAPSGQPAVCSRPAGLPEPAVASTSGRGQLAGRLELPQQRRVQVCRASRSPTQETVHVLAVAPLSGLSPYGTGDTDVTWGEVRACCMLAPWQR